MKLFLKILGGFAAFGILVFVVVSLTSSGAAKVSDQFINYVQTQKSAEAYVLLAKEAAATVTEAQFKDIVDRISPILSGKPRTTGKQIGADAASGSEATISYEIDGTDDLTYNVSVRLAKVDGEWKVLSFDSKRK